MSFQRFNYIIKEKLILTFVRRKLKINLSLTKLPVKGSDLEKIRSSRKERGYHTFCVMPTVNRPGGVIRTGHINLKFSDW